MPTTSHPVRSARMTHAAGFGGLVGLVTLATLACFHVACSGSSEPAGPPVSEDPDGSFDAGSGELPPVDGGQDAADGAPGQAPGDAGSDAAPASSVIAEVEPNDTEETIQSIPVPSTVTGAVDPVGDIDAFRAKLTAGAFLVWRLEPTGADWMPYLGVVEKSDAVPHYVARADKGAGAIELEQFVLGTSDYNVLVSDQNNVKSGGTKVGSPTFGYKLSVRTEARTPTPIAVGQSLPATLATPYAAGLFALTLAAETGLDIDVRAKRKVPPSDMDARLSLFDVTRSKWAGTNDDLALDQSDAQLGSDALPAGSYIIVVENVAPTAKDLSFEVAIKAR